MSAEGGTGEHRDHGERMPNERRRLPPELVEITRISERNKTIRFISTGLFTVIGLGILTYGVVTIVVQPPLWQVLLTALVGIFGASPVFVVVLIARAKYVKKTHGRITKLEKMQDSKRTSSEGHDAGAKP